ncbi:unnamed protein product [Amaranthus hypochondriacus]
MEGFRLPYNANLVVPQMQIDDGDKNTSFLNLPEKQSLRTPNFSQHKFPVTSFDNNCQNDAAQARNMLKQIPVSTGLKLSYGEEEPNSSISSPGESMRVNLSSILSQSHNNNLQSEFARQSNEFDQYIMIQEENIRKGITELNHRHTISLLNAVEKEVNLRMHEKDVEIQTLNQINKDLIEKIRQMAVEAQVWHSRAKQNEALVNVLRNNINQVFLQGAAALKEGCDDNLEDDAVSSCNRNILEPSFDHRNVVSSKELVNCKVCKSKEVSVLMMPCRHLCLCIDCCVFIDVCPICRVKKAGILQVYMS